MSIRRRLLRNHRSSLAANCLGWTGKGNHAKLKVLAFVRWQPFLFRHHQLAGTRVNAMPACSAARLSAEEDLCPMPAMNEFPQSPPFHFRVPRRSRLACLFACAFLLCWNSPTHHLHGEEADNQRSGQRRPNIVLFVADDLGYGELGCYGQEHIKTPHIDSIAANGIRFTQHYSGQAVCAPSRCSLMTGMHQGHSYIRGNGNPPERRGKGTPRDLYFPGQNPIPDSTVTVAELLKQQGYATAAIGKWGLGYENSSGDPNRQGFDLFYGFLCQVHAHNHYPRFLWRNGEKELLPGNDRTLEGETFSQDKFTEVALDFVRANREQPFFLYMPYAIPHLSIQAPPESVEEYLGKIPEEDYEHRGYLQHPHPRAGYAAMISHLDRDIGQVMNLVRELGLEEDTLFLFTSDNGPTYDRLGGSDSDFFNSSGPLSGRKGSLLEGGIRVPLVACWKGQIPAGQVSDLQSAFWDYLPTFCEVAGADIPAGIDGISMLPTLRGEPQSETHDFLYWEFPSYGGQQAVRMGNWKGIRRGLIKDPAAPLQLYDLESDVGESTDVAAQHPEIVRQIQSIMQREHTPSDLFPFPALDEPRGE